MTTTADIAYRLQGCAAGALMGAHRSRAASGQGVFLDRVPFLRQPDPRRVDLRQSLRDPFETVYVRRYEERLAITLYVIVDLSRSLSFEGASRKFSQAAQLCELLARSAHKLGDAFGLIGCDTVVREDFHLPATRHRSDYRIRQMFENFSPDRAGAGGLVDASRLISGRRKLVFLLSDFYMPLKTVEDVVHSLSRHDVVPIILRDSLEERAIPSWGLVQVSDLETARQRVLLMRPALRKRWIADADARRTALHELFLRCGCKPFELVDQLIAEDLSRHLLNT